MHDFYTESHNFIPIKGFEHDYAIDCHGRVLSLLTDQYITPSVDTNGYLKVTLMLDGKRTVKRVHRLVAEHFIPNDDPAKTVINHIDGNKQNPDYTNLEWCTQQENTQHAHTTGLQTKTSDKKVVRGDGRVYGSLTKAAQESNTSKSAISKVLKGERKTAGGWTWQVWKEGE
jgi:hypothetical protein